MKNEKILKEWMEFAEMDFLTAKHYMSICTRNRWRLFVTIASRL